MAWREELWKYVRFLSVISRYSPSDFPHPFRAGSELQQTHQSYTVSLQRSDLCTPLSTNTISYADLDLSVRMTYQNGGKVTVP